MFALWGREHNPLEEYGGVNRIRIVGLYMNERTRHKKIGVWISFVQEELLLQKSLILGKFTQQQIDWSLLISRRRRHIIPKSTTHLMTHMRSWTSCNNCANSLWHLIWPFKEHGCVKKWYLRKGGGGSMCPSTPSLSRLPSRCHRVMRWQRGIVMTHGNLVTPLAWWWRACHHRKKYGRQVCCVPASFEAHVKWRLGRHFTSMKSVVWVGWRPPARWTRGSCEIVLGAFW